MDNNAIGTASADIFIEAIVICFFTFEGKRSREDIAFDCRHDRAGVTAIAAETAKAERRRDRRAGRCKGERTRYVDSTITAAAAKTLDCNAVSFGSMRRGQAFAIERHSVGVTAAAAEPANANRSAN